ncbi:MAG: hypothetical protein IKK56_02185 [Methanocorpusculum sp.]|nr:hypothetical protein [Methanocorpusculum sp.]
MKLEGLGIRLDFTTESADEMKQILSVPDGIIEPKHCGCCCIEGCGCE